MQRKSLWLTILPAMVLGFTLGTAFLRPISAAQNPAAPADKTVIKVVAKKFEYTPKDITAHKGQPVVLQLTTQDRSHGFNLPAMHLRTDIEPGKVSELTFTPTKAGKFDFYCDIFCGSGHEDMGGTLTVIE